MSFFRVKIPKKYFTFSHARERPRLWPRAAATAAAVAAAAAAATVTATAMAEVDAQQNELWWCDQDAKLSWSNENYGRGA